MAEEDFTLTTFYTSWKDYQDRLKAALALLSTEQLSLRPASGQRSIGETAVHMLGCRRVWFTEFLGEDGGEEIKSYAHWEEPEAPSPTGAELAAAFDHTWQFMADCLARWSTGDMRQTFSDQRDGRFVELSRAHVVWHVLEHDLHHGGEVSLILGMHGIQAEFPTVWFPD
jgi:uncharacterized damage-inducible protein DinB